MDAVVARRRGRLRINTTIGRIATALHVLSVLAVGLAGLGLLLVIVAVMMLDPDPYSRDMAVLALFISTPVWLVGLIAGLYGLSLLRGRPITRPWALAWGLAILGAGALLAVAGGQIDVASALLTRPDLVTFDWPVITLISADRLGARYVYVNQPGFWLPIIALLLGAAGLLGLLIDWRAREKQVGTAAIQEGTPASR